LLLVSILSHTKRKTGQFFVKGLPRIKAYAASPAGAVHAQKYAAKISFVEGLLAIYTRTASQRAQTEFFAASQANFEASRVFLIKILPSALSSSGHRGPFSAGAAPGEDDFHIIGWLAHAAFCAGARNAGDAMAALERRYGVRMPDNIVSLWRAWTARESFRRVYPGGQIY
jgi:hypothetical protein